MARIDDIGIRQVDTTDDGPRPGFSLIGLSHHTADFELLEHAAFDGDRARRAARTLRRAPGVLEAAVLSTCNRTELFLVTTDHESAVEAARSLLRSTGISDRGAVYVKFGRDVSTHLFRVSAGLDSLMVGEVQILGQVKKTLHIAEEESTSGPLLGRLFASAFRAGKRARSETSIGEGAVSVSYAALGLASKIFSDLRERDVLVVGAGATGALAAKHFSEAGVSNLTIANRTRERADTLARELGRESIDFDACAEMLGQVDIVVTATSSPTPVIDRTMVEAHRSRRSKRRLVFIDIAMPRDVDPAINELEGVFVHDMAALESIVERNLERRRREVPAVEAIIAGEVERFTGWESSLEVGPTIRALRDHVEAIRVDGLESIGSDLSPEDLEKVDRATRTMMNKLLHQPLSRTRRPPAGSGNAMQIAAFLRQLFGIDDELDDNERHNR